jgi:hypothetical protein
VCDTLCCVAMIVTQGKVLSIDVNGWLTEFAHCSDSDICERWSKIYSLSPSVLRWQKGELSSDTQKEVTLSVISEWQHRLSSISWLIHCHRWRSPFGSVKAVPIFSKRNNVATHNYWRIFAHWSNISLSLFTCR